LHASAEGQAHTVGSSEEQELSVPSRVVAGPGNRRRVEQNGELIAASTWLSWLL